jgi:hypothetical protein
MWKATFSSPKDETHGEQRLEKLQLLYQLSNNNMNAKYELLRHIADREVKYVQINHELGLGDSNIKIEGTLEEVLPRLDFDYDSGYGSQELFGTIWYNDGSWSDRGEYDGSEWWQYQKCPPLPEGASQ